MAVAPLGQRTSTTDVPSVGDGATGTTDILSVEGWLVTSNAYNGASTRILSSTFHAPTLAPRTTFYIYNDLGEQVGTVLDGVTNRTDTTYETDSSNVVWRVVTSTVVGPSTNSLTITRTRLTGLSDACRRHMIELVGRAAPCTPSGGSPSLATATVTETLVAFDPSTGIETETVTSSIAPTIVRCYLHGVLLSTETNGETAFNSYDAFGRLAATGRTGVQPVPDGATGTTDILSVAGGRASSRAACGSGRACRGRMESRHLGGVGRDCRPPAQWTRCGSLSPSPPLPL